MADPAKSVRKHMQQETADELAGRQAHDFGPLRMPVILPAETDLSVGESEEPIVGDGNPVRVAAEIVEHLLRTAERALGIDDPFDLVQGPQMGGEGWRFGEPGQLSKEAQDPAI